MRALLTLLIVLVWAGFGGGDAAARGVDPLAVEQAQRSDSPTTLAAAGRDYPCGCTTRYHYRWFLRWTRAYGRAVGRWADDAARAGWPPCSMPTLGRVIYRESRGDPRARNPYSGCAGLLQLSRYWYRVKWHFDPFDPRLNLYYGHRVWRSCGWHAWVTY